MSAPLACGRADTTQASMVNAKKIFFIIVRNVYEAFDFTAPQFIQVIIRKQRWRRACSIIIKAQAARYIGAPPSVQLLQKATKETKLFLEGSLLIVGVSRSGQNHARNAIFQNRLVKVNQ
jgi:hypothetical protein